MHRAHEPSGFRSSSSSFSSTSSSILSPDFEQEDEDEDEKDSIGSWRGAIPLAAREALSASQRSARMQTLSGAFVHATVPSLS